MRGLWGVILGVFFCLATCSVRAQQFNGPNDFVDELPYAPLFRLPELTNELPEGTPAAESIPPPAAETPLQKPAEEEVLPPSENASRSAFEVGTSLGDPVFWQAVWKPWEGNVELGMSGTDGNSETFNIRLGANAKYTAATRVHSSQLVYIEKTAQGVQTAHSLLADNRIEWPWAGSPWNYFVHSLVEYDEFKAFDWRLSGDTGFGYEFIQNDITNLVGRFGLSASHEIGGPDDSVNPELLFGCEFKHKFDDRNSISFKSDYYPTVTDFNDYRLNSQAAWEMVVSAEWGLSLKLSVIDRYDSTPHAAKPNDIDYSTLAIWSF